MANAVSTQKPMIHRAWRIVGGLSMNLGIGTLYAWSMFVAPLESQFGWNRLQISRAFTIAIVVFAAAFILAGKLQDRFGPFWVSIIGGLLVSCGYFMCAETQSLRWLYFWFGLVVGFGMGFGYATPIPVMAKWFPDHRGLAVGLAVAGFGGAAAIFGPLCSNYLIPSYGLPATFRILSGIFFVMTMLGAFLLKNPPLGYKPEGWNPTSATAKAGAKPHEFTPREVLDTPAFYLMWVAYAFGGSSGLMVISQLVPFTKEKQIPAAAASTALIIGALGNVSGRMLSGWMSDTLGRLNVLRLMIAISIIAMPLLYAVGGSIAGLYFLVFVVYWCFGTQLSVNASTAADFWGTKNAGINYGMLYTAYGAAGVIGPWIGSAFFDRFHNYQAAFLTASGLATIALICELLARRPTVLIPAADPVDASSLL